MTSGDKPAIRALLKVSDPATFTRPLDEGRRVLDVGKRKRESLLGQA